MPSPPVTVTVTDSPVVVEVTDEEVSVESVAQQGPGGPPGADGDDGSSGPNSIDDATALGALTDASADAAFVLAGNAAGTFARKVTLGSVARSFLGATTQAAARTAIDAEQAGTATAAVAAHLAAANPHTQYPLLAAANTFAAGPQVFVGGATVRQAGGTPGTNEAAHTHDGTHYYLTNKVSSSGAAQLKLRGDTVRVDVVRPSDGAIAGYLYASRLAAVGTDTADKVYVNETGLRLTSAAVVGWNGSNNNPGTALDTQLTRNTSGGVLITNTLTFAPQLTVKATASQTGNLTEWVNSSGSMLARITATGAANFGNSSLQGTAATFRGDGTNSTAPGQFVIQATGVSNENCFIDFYNSTNSLIGRMVFAQTQGTTQIQHGSGFRPDISIRQSDGFTSMAGNEVIYAGRLSVGTNGSGYKGLVVRGASGQTANLTELQNNGGTVLAGFSAAGRLLFNAADTAPADTATPAQWLTCTVNGVQYRLPLYL